jgi:hypothetical protein
VYVPSLELGLSHPSPPSDYVASPRNQRGGGHTRLQVRGGGVPIPATREKSYQSACSVDVSKFFLLPKTFNDQTFAQDLLMINFEETSNFVTVFFHATINYNALDKDNVREF